MKKIFIALGLLILSGAGLKAQTLYDAQRYMGRDLNGTARFVGMGGAMSALGTDLSVMGVNPAGIGLYRSNDIVTSFGFNLINVSAPSNDMNKWHGSFDQIGVVFSNKMSHKGILRFINFGFNYKKSRNFDRSMAMTGDYFGSQMDQMISMTNGVTPSALDASNALANPNLPWLGVMAYRGNVITPKAQGSDEYIRNVGVEFDGSGNATLLPSLSEFSVKESGGLHSYDFNFSMNLNDCLYLGATLGAYSVDYSRESFYAESFANDISNYSLQSYLKTEGAGVDLKLGMILRPFESIPLRIGASIHTPTFFSLTDYSSAILTSDVDLNNDGQIDKDEAFIYDTLDEYGQDVENKYELITPWKYNLSLGYTIGRYVALGAEYEYTDYSSAKLKDRDGNNLSDDNAIIKNRLEGQHAFRIGAEFKIIPEVSLRMGYNYITAPIKDANNYDSPLLANNAVTTMTDYSNQLSSSNYTLGLGYRGSMFYADIAYQLNTYNENFYPFDVKDLAATSISNNNHRVLMTVGLRF